MTQHKWKRNETKRKVADTQINLGEKFFYAAYISPLIVLIKFDFNINTIIFSVAILSFFTLIGISLIRKGWENYDKLKD